MFLNVTQRSSQKIRVVLKLAQSDVALSTKKRAYVAAPMAVVDLESALPSADRARPVLRLVKLAHRFLAHIVAVLRPAQTVAVAKLSDRLGRQIGAPTSGVVALAPLRIAAVVPSFVVGLCSLRMALSVALGGESEAFTARTIFGGAEYGAIVAVPA